MSKTAVLLLKVILLNRLGDFCVTDNVKKKTCKQELRTSKIND